MLEQTLRAAHRGDGFLQGVEPLEHGRWSEEPDHMSVEKENKGMKTSKITKK